MSADEEYQPCPSAECTFGLYMAKGGGDLFTCHLCGLKWCLTCDAKYHSGQTCAQYIEERRKAEAKDKTLKAQAKEIRKSLRTIDETSKPCPGCGVKIEKRDGCDHMTCKWCFAFSMILRAEMLTVFTSQAVAARLNSAGSALQTTMALWHILGGQCSPRGNMQLLPSSRPDFGRGGRRWSR